MNSTRRRFVTAAVAAGGFVGLSGAIGSTVGARTPAGSSFELIGNLSGWEGVAPGAIAGQTNPTLVLEAGATVHVTWENGDGMPHNFAVRDTNGNTVMSSGLISEGTQTVEFEATQSLDGGEYLCEPHPGSMAGAIEVVADDPPDGDDDDTEDDEETVDDDDHDDHDDDDVTVDDQPDDAAAMFVTPEDGDTVESPVQIEAAVEGVDLAPAGQAAVGEGHLHVLVNRDPFPEGEAIPGPSDAAEADGIYHWGDGSSSGEIDLEPGEYDLVLQLGDGPHRAFGETDEISITVDSQRDDGADDSKDDQKKDDQDKKDDHKKDDRKKDDKRDDDGIPGFGVLAGLAGVGAGAAGAAAHRLRGGSESSDEGLEE